MANMEENIRTRAYLLWEAEGRQDGNLDEYWHRAREPHSSRSPVGVSPDAVQGAP